jgi:hypothetical protein
MRLGRLWQRLQPLAAPEMPLDKAPPLDEPIWITARPPLQRMMADRALHRRTTSAQHPNSERLDREPGPNDPTVAG